MKAAVQSLGKPLEASLGGKSGGISPRKKTQNDAMRKLLLKIAERNADLLSKRNVGENLDDVGLKSGGRSRT
jgi:hypothetical protein